MLHLGILYIKLINKILDHNPEPARQEVPDIPHPVNQNFPPERAWFSNRKLFFVAVLILLVTIGIYASNCGCDELVIKKLKDDIAFLEQENEQLRVDCKSQIDQLEINLRNMNTELSIINPQLSNTNMNYNTCRAQQEYFRQQYETEKKEKEMYRNRVDNMTEEMHLLRLEHRDQLHSKIQDLTTCENHIRICEDFHLKHCTETVTQLNINDEECKEDLKKYSVKLAHCEMKGRYAASDLSRCQRDYKECSDELDKYKKRTCFGLHI